MNSTTRIQITIDPKQIALVILFISVILSVFYVVANGQKTQASGPSGSRQAANPMNPPKAALPLPNPEDLPEELIGTTWRSQFGAIMSFNRNGTGTFPDRGDGFDTVNGGWQGDGHYIDWWQGTTRSARITSYSLNDEKTVITVNYERLDLHRTGTLVFTRTN
jgi:hypothetical protein